MKISMAPSKFIKHSTFLSYQIKLKMGLKLVNHPLSCVINQQFNSNSFLGKKKKSSKS